MSRIRASSRGFPGHGEGDGEIEDGWRLPKAMPTTRPPDFSNAMTIELTKPGFALTISMRMAGGQFDLQVRDGAAGCPLGHWRPFCSPARRSLPGRFFGRTRQRPDASRYRS